MLPTSIPPDRELSRPGHRLPVGAATPRCTASVEQPLTERGSAASPGSAGPDSSDASPGDPLLGIAIGVVGGIVIYAGFALVFARMAGAL